MFHHAPASDKISPVAGAETLDVYKRKQWGSWTHQQEHKYGISGDTWLDEHSTLGGVQVRAKDVRLAGSILLNLG